MSFGVFFTISIGTIFMNNFVLAQFLGLCPFIGVSKKLDSVLGMGLAVIFVMTIASMVTWVVYKGILVNTSIPGITSENNLEFLKIVIFILVIASLVQLV
ncbi:MAG: electron transport complex subunit RsxA, partial [Spirochaetes bacterium]|nr:electron transport complex subunit RsxA [Spirochaetota bacterium]